MQKDAGGAWGRLDSFKKGISALLVQGYKSVTEEREIEIRPLTILAGANSSGKSSLVQPLLLLKQTLDANIDPGPLLLDGPNVKFTSADQLFSKLADGSEATEFKVGVQGDWGQRLTLCFNRGHDSWLQIKDLTFGSRENPVTLRPRMRHDEIELILPQQIKDFFSPLLGPGTEQPEYLIIRDRCFLSIALKAGPPGRSVEWPWPITPHGFLTPVLRNVIHLPGLRGNPERTYPVTAARSPFPGTFDKYAASVVGHWQDESNVSKLGALCKDLDSLGLTWKINAKRISDTQIEIRVGRLPHLAKGGEKDLVSIADVGLGVSQSLPVVVALHVAEPGQLVYLEQPEIHLHPRAQFKLAEVFAAAAKRSVRLIVETHSSLLLLGIQTLVAEGELSPDLVKLHWFKRREDGVTDVTSADIDKRGAFGDWPEDFADVALEAESRYLDAAEVR